MTFGILMMTRAKNEILLSFWKLTILFYL